MEEKLGLNPWMNIWVHPRKTIRRLVEYNTEFRLIPLCAIYGFQYLLRVIQYLSLGKDLSLTFMILLAFIFSVPVGYVLFNIQSAFCLWMGKLMKGKGHFKEIRAAIYWPSSVPMIVTCLIWIVLMTFHGNNLFVTGYETQLTGTEAIINMGLGMIQLVVGIWGFIILLHALGEVQKFSAWMALLNLILAGLVVFALLFLIVWGISSFVNTT